MATAISSERQRVLIVEDDLQLAGFLARVLLQQEGFKAIRAYTRLTAISFCEKIEFDLAVVGMKMPDQEATEKTPSGLIFIKWLREKRPEIKIIAMSGGEAPVGLPSDIVFLQEPFSADVFLAAIKNTLQD